jgi:hypothetical protein
VWISRSIPGATTRVSRPSSRSCSPPLIRISEKNLGREMPKCRPDSPRSIVHARQAPRRPKRKESITLAYLKFPSTSWPALHGMDIAADALRDGAWWSRDLGSDLRVCYAAHARAAKGGPGQATGRRVDEGQLRGR